MIGGADDGGPHGDGLLNDNLCSYYSPPCCSF